MKGEKQIPWKGGRIVRNKEKGAGKLVNEERPLFIDKAPKVVPAQTKKIIEAFENFEAFENLEAIENFKAFETFEAQETKIQTRPLSMEGYNARITHTNHGRIKGTQKNKGKEGNQESIKREAPQNNQSSQGNLHRKPGRGDFKTRVL